MSMCLGWCEQAGVMMGVYVGWNGAGGVEYFRSPMGELNGPGTTLSPAEATSQLRSWGYQLSDGLLDDLLGVYRCAHQMSKAISPPDYRATASGPVSAAPGPASTQ